VVAMASVGQIYGQYSTSFITYENPRLGFSIEHPSDWETWENENVTFMIPPNTIRNLTSSLYDAPLIIHVQNVSPYLDTDTMTVKNKTLDQLAPRMMRTLSENNSLGLEFKPIRENYITVDGQPGWKIEAFLGPEENPLYYFFDASTVSNGKVYHMLYGEKPLKVPETYPIVKKILESFRFIQ
jgi:hypothetical protein